VPAVTVQINNAVQAVAVAPEPERPAPAGRSDSSGEKKRARDRERRREERERFRQLMPGATKPDALASKEIRTPGGQAGTALEGRLAEGEGFEPPVPFRAQRFSRPPVSTAHPSLRVSNIKSLQHSKIGSQGSGGNRELRGRITPTPEYGTEHSQFTDQFGTDRELRSDRERHDVENHLAENGAGNK
jgi:hypothetical protein